MLFLQLWHIEDSYWPPFRADAIPRKIGRSFQKPASWRFFFRRGKGWVANNIQDASEKNLRPSETYEMPEFGGDESDESVNLKWVFPLIAW